MIHKILTISLFIILIILESNYVSAASDDQTFENRSGIIEGPLRVSYYNPRYFADRNDKLIYLTGSHTWDNFQDWGQPTPDFNYLSYLDFLERYNHNFIRLWVWESTKVNIWAQSDIAPLPWDRTGPGIANDGKPKFNLLKFNQSYFDRLRSRVFEACKRGIYVSIMLFQRHSDWNTHPFNRANNINGIDGDLDKDGKREVHTLTIQEITSIQKAYTQKVIDTVNDLDNVLYEIGNELKSDTIEWQYHMINYIHSYEAGKPKQHPVGMTSSGGYGHCKGCIMNSYLLNSPADWVSLHVEDGQSYNYDPPPADGKKVIISDTDHIGFLGKHAAEWVWKSFLRGLNPIFMDAMQNGIPGDENKEWNDPGNPTFPTARIAMGQTRKYANRMKLAQMVPHNELASTKYCLANPGVEYLIYIPESGNKNKMLNWFLQFMEVSKTVTVDLSIASVRYKIEWFNPRTGEATDGGEISGGTSRSFKVPFSGDAVLYIYVTVHPLP